ncbi:MAG: hypothetical protein Q4D19_03220 [Lautropia sp.]|nr:hypothetical protein [Lautropia sp.]
MSARTSRRMGSLLPLQWQAASALAGVGGAGLKAGALLACIVLHGCALMKPAPSLPQAFPPLAEARQFRVEGCEAKEGGDAGQGSDAPDAGGQTPSLVVVQPQEDGSWRWQRLDAFGAPQARMIARPGGRWQNDGFMPPNAEARALFDGMLMLLTPESQRARVWPELHAQPDGLWTNHLDGKALRWRTRPDGEGWRLQLQDGTVWCVQPLS